ncbi:uncharacterized protein BO88DRAFT_409114 [Aspergillus vadensis CBS 113365]|uniref:Uncharacterized protein n=1 Tax=Aspergillus vadensis (strain CBS 113365 / IMI 142717 / IBT 24658) TaxID=1448311 RepID=A0A319AVG5_ASPVC|nr:hypothetical protein BO88DRAFT_409114 [Aspergillus vadensis CBS 113365]PYH63564.1 hypothetical protein BO88DRAFT_409114 [Aspergillus vadensis CBS 113365]
MNPSPAMMPTTLPTMSSESPTRKRASSEDSDYRSPSASPTSSGSIPNPQESKIREAEDWGRYSPRALVAGRLGRLAIRGDQFSTSPVPYGVDQGIVAHTAQSGNWPTSDGDSHESNALSEANTAMEISPSPGKLSDFAEATQSPETAKTGSPSPRKRRSTPSPRKKKLPTTSSTMRSRSASPPLITDTAENPLTWHDSEITGHNPTDPTDDGYGLNGIGFKPTAAMAWARSERRKKQVAEWRSREAREAREKRRERRDGADFERIRSIQSGAIQKRVKFDV